MDLGAFSVSLAVKDLKTSKTFYEKLGFTQFAGEGNFAIMKNGDHVIGLFQGMFENNILTFNPGWDQSGQETSTFTDVRKLQKQLQDAGVDSEPIEAEQGPASFMVTDPDGNTILFDQHR